MRRWLAPILCLAAIPALAGTLPLLGVRGGSGSAGSQCAYGSGSPDGCAAASTTNSFQVSDFFTDTSAGAPRSGQTYQDATFTGSISAGVLTVSGVSGTIHANDTLIGASVPAGTVVASGAGSTWNLTLSGSAASGLNVGSQSMSTLIRPNWNMAGVDYRVGIDLSQVPGGVLRDPNTLNSGVCKWAATNGGAGGNGQVSCASDSAAGFDLNGYDFSLHGCTYLTVAGTVTGPIVIRNSKFISGGASSFTGSMNSGTVTIISGQQGTPIIGQYISGTSIPTGTTITGGSGTTWTTSASATTLGSRAMTTGNGSCGMIGIFKTINIAGGSTVDFKNNYMDGCVLTSGTTNVATDCALASQNMNNINSNFIVISSAPTGTITIGPYNVLLNTSRVVAYGGVKDFAWKYNYAEQSSNLAAHGEQSLLNGVGVATGLSTINLTWLYSTFMNPPEALTVGVTADISLFEALAAEGGVIGTGGGTAVISGSGALLTVTAPCTGTIQAGDYLGANDGTRNAYVISSFGTGAGCAGTYNLTGPAVNVTNRDMVFGRVVFGTIDIEGNVLIDNCAASAGGCGHGSPSRTSGENVRFDTLPYFGSVTMKFNYMDPTGNSGCYEADKYAKIGTLTLTDNVNLLAGFGGDPIPNNWAGLPNTVAACAGHG